MSEINFLYIEKDAIHSGKHYFYKLSCEDIKSLFNKENEFDAIVNTFNEFAHKLLGGQQDKSFDSIIDDQNKSFNEMLESFKIDKYIGKNILFDVNQCLKSELNKHKLLQSKNFDAKEEIWKSLNIKQDELGTLEGSNILEQIWSKVKLDFCGGNDIDLKDFLLQGQHNAKCDEEIIDNKIVAILTLLNFFSYSSDKNRKKLSSFIGSQNDQLHLMHAKRCDAFLSLDNRLVKKAVVAYQYLDIKNEIFKVVKRNQSYFLEQSFPLESNMVKIQL